VWWDKQKAPVALFRCETGDESGYGHFFRSLALAEAWVARGGDAHIYPTEPVSGPSWPTFDKTADTYIDLATTLYPQYGAKETGFSDDLLLRELVRFDVDWCVLDGYGIGPDLQRTVKQTTRCLVIDDDGCHGQYYADAILNPGVASDAVPYQLHGGTRLWLGSTYALVRKAIRAQRPMTRVPAQRLRTILVAMGVGTHAREALVPIIQQIDQARRDQDADWTVRVVVGPALAEEMEGIERFAGVELVENDPDAFPTWLVESDLLISAGGVTAVEAAYLGTPMLLFPQAANQELMAQAWTTQGATLAADVEDIPSLLGRWDAREWSAFAQVGQGLIDGQGADRVVTEMRITMGLDADDRI